MARSRSGSTLARPSLILGLVLLGSWVVLFAPSASLVPPAWPAAGLLAGLLLTSGPARRPALAAVGGIALVVAHALHGVGLPVAAALAAVSVTEALVVSHLMTRGTGHGPPTLLVDGDVSRLIRGIAVGAAVAAAGYALVGRLSGDGSPWLGAAGAYATHAASLMIILPVFLRTPAFAALAPRRERIAQWTLAVGTTLVIFASSDVPPLVFLVMPMFAWLGFRGTLREATVVLMVVAAVSTAATALGLGPVAALSTRYGFPDELVDAYLQVFLLDCGLVLLPLAVAVAQQREAAARAVRGRDTLARIVDSATGTAIIAADLDGRLTVFNPGAEAILGYRAAEVLGRSIDELLEPESLARQSSAPGTGPGSGFVAVCRVLVANESVRRPWLFVRSDGEHRTLHMTLTAVPGTDGSVPGYLVTGEDVTERERVREALVLALDDREKSLRRLREIDEIRADLISTVSHELRTPITSILGYTEMLGDGMAGELSAAQATMLDRVTRNSHRLLELVENLATLSSPGSDQPDPVPQQCDLRAVATSAHRCVQESARVRGIELVLDVPEVAAEVWGDPDQLERMLVNLLSNSIKFSAADARVVLSLHNASGVARLSVEDSGVGIPDTEQQQVFDRFFRSSVAREREIQGAGLGLAIVQQIVERHGGTISLVSSLGVGTRVDVELPLPGLAPARAAALPTAERPREGGIPSSQP